MHSSLLLGILGDSFAVDNNLRCQLLLPRVTTCLQSMEN